MAGWTGSIYNSIIRRNAVFVGVIFGAAFGFEIAFDVYSQRFWDWKNQGRQWKDIRHKYVTDEE
ncbi:hypothetical protein H072_3616 [Dactylellina haptotyla CBS 200.50]|uniref:Complex III subunit 9 n=1 Tax=Dactylellina haptotyla (strain CBS 200.50) TaxID=1284197 RepID=S8C454_DACHA|nr:hypothetical protein H072_3616 [Dactylellina haptotyla CBS 200.50]